MTQTLHDFPDYQGSLTTADLDATFGTSNLAGGVPITSSVLDMRSYNSYSIRAWARQNAAGTAFNPCRLDMYWYADQAAGRELYRERIGWWGSNNNVGAFASQLGRLYIHDATKGSFLQFEIYNMGPDTLSCSNDVSGRSRSLGMRYVQNMSDSIAILDLFRSSNLITSGGVALAAGATANYLAPLAPGLAHVRLAAITTPHTFIFTDGAGQDIGSFVLAVGAEVRELIALPQSGIKVSVTNTGGVIGTHIVNVVSARDNW